MNLFEKRLEWETLVFEIYFEYLRTLNVLRKYTNIRKVQDW